MSGKQTVAPAFCAVFLADNSYKTIQIVEHVSTTVDVIRIVLDKSQNPRLAEDYQLVIKYADQSESWLEHSAKVDLLISQVVVKIFLRLSLERAPDYVDKKKRMIKAAAKKKKKKGKEKPPDEQEALRELHNAWYAGKMQRLPTEKAVLSGKHGYFLIRTSLDPSKVVLVVNDNGTICNFEISCQDQFVIGQNKYTSLLDLLGALKETPPEGNYGVGVELTYPAAGGIVLESSSRNSVGSSVSRSGSAAGSPPRRQPSGQRAIPESVRNEALSPQSSSASSHNSTVSKQSSLKSQTSITEERDNTPVRRRSNSQPPDFNMHRNSLQTRTMSDNGEAMPHTFASAKVSDGTSSSSMQDLRPDTATLPNMATMQPSPPKRASSSVSGSVPSVAALLSTSPTKRSVRRVSKNGEILYEEIPVNSLLGAGLRSRISRVSPARRSAKDALPGLPPGMKPSQSVSDISSIGWDNNRSMGPSPRPRPRSIRAPLNAEGSSPSTLMPATSVNSLLPCDTNSNSDGLSDSMVRMSLSQNDVRLVHNPTARPRKSPSRGSSISSNGPGPSRESSLQMSPQPVRRKMQRAISASTSMKAPMATPRASIAIRGQRATSLRPQPRIRSQSAGADFALETSFGEADANIDANQELYMNTDMLTNSIQPEETQAYHEADQELYMNTSTLLNDVGALQDESTTDDDYLHVGSTDQELYMNTSEALGGLIGESNTDADDHGYSADTQELYMNTTEALSADINLVDETEGGLGVDENGYEDNDQDLYMNTAAALGFENDQAIADNGYNDNQQELYMNTLDAIQNSRDDHENDFLRDEHGYDDQSLYMNSAQAQSSMYSLTTPHSGHEQEELYMAPEATEMTASNVHDSEPEELYMAPEIVETKSYPNDEELYMAPEIKEPIAHSTSMWNSFGSPTVAPPVPPETESDDEEEEEEDWDDDGNYDILDRADASLSGTHHRSKSAIGRSMIRRIRHASGDPHKSRTSSSGSANVDSLYETPEAQSDLYATPEIDENVTDENLYMEAESSEGAAQPVAVILPSGWVKVYDKTHKRDYYFHQETRKVQWTLPSHKV